MNSLLKIVLAAAATLVSVTLVPAAPAAAAPFVCDNTADTPLTGNHPRLQVIVEEGASCYIEDAVIFSLQADHPENVSILGTSLEHGVQHNVMIRGATGNVVIGNEGCAFDPKVGNNIVVRNSNNVLICQMSVDNNITVTGSHGRVTIRDSVACDNITASRNHAYDVTDSTHHNAGAIRLLHLRAANHITAVDNSGRTVIERDTVENFLSPSACRLTLR